MRGWIGVDLDGTLATYHPGNGIQSVGEPIPAMVNRVRGWLSQGRDVRIVTARVAACRADNSDGITDSDDLASEQRELIQAWCMEQFGMALVVTASKDFRMIELWDDRAVQVETNTGVILGWSNHA